MKKMFKKSILAGFGTLLGLAGIQSHAATGSLNTDVYLNIVGGVVNIYSTGSFNFGTFTISNAVQTPQQQFVDYFSVEDLKGSNSGFYTSISITNLSGTVAGNYIPATNVSIKVPAGTPDLITGSTNANVLFGASITTSYTTLGSVLTFLKRDVGTNNGLLSHYGTKPRLQVEIPAFQAVDSYHGVMTYTLYEDQNG